MSSSNSDAPISHGMIIARNEPHCRRSRINMCCSGGKAVRLVVVIPSDGRLTNERFAS